MTELEELLTDFKKVQSNNVLDVLWFLTKTKIFIDDLSRLYGSNETFNYLEFIINSEFDGFETDIEDTLMVCYDVLIQAKAELQ